MPLLLLLAHAAPPASAESAEPLRGDPQARLPGGERGGEAWDLLASFDSGHLIFAIAAIHNLGFGDGHAVVTGLWVDPDGGVQRFGRSEDAGKWTLAAEGRRLDLRSVVLDLSVEPWRFEVDKNELRIDLALEPEASPAWSELPLTPGCPLDVLRVASQAEGSFWREGMEDALPLVGRAALTHRWMEGAEARCIRRRLELHAHVAGMGIYFTEVLAPSGARRRFALVVRDGEVVAQGAPEMADLAWAHAEGGRPVLESLRLRVAGLDLELEESRPLATFRPMGRQPRWLRRLHGSEGEISLSRASLSVAGAPESPASGVIKVSRFAEVAQ